MYLVEHPDDESVALFSFAMKQKMAEKRKDGHGGWDDPNDVSIRYLMWLLANEMRKPVVDVVDVANYCMMLHQRGITKIDKHAPSRDGSA
jgi:hypothetical protein